MTLHWLSESIVRALHSELLKEHGGLPGPPKPGALEGSLARPKQILASQTPAPSLVELAAAYGFAFARNHCFPDGNKRVALAAIDVFLRLQDHELIADEREAVTMLEGTAAGTVAESQLAAWIAANSGAVTS